MTNTADTVSDTHNELATRGKALKRWLGNEASTSKIGVSLCVPEDQNKAEIQGQTPTTNWLQRAGL